MRAAAARISSSARVRFSSGERALEQIEVPVHDRQRRPKIMRYQRYDLRAHLLKVSFLGDVADRQEVRATVTRANDAHHHPAVCVRTGLAPYGHRVFESSPHQLVGVDLAAIFGGHMQILEHLVQRSFQEHAERFVEKLRRRAVGDVNDTVDDEKLAFGGVVDHGAQGFFGRKSELIGTLELRLPDRELREHVLDDRAKVLELVGQDGTEL